MILLLFVVAVLGFVYLFQTSFLDSFYIRNKINTLQSVTDEVSQYVGLQGMNNVLDQVGMSNEVCVRVVSNNDTYNYEGACSLRNIDRMTINMIASETIEAGNEKLFDDFNYQRPFASNPEKIYIYTRMMEINNELVMIMTSTSITPLNATISTLKSQYVIIALTVIGMSILLALLISRFILKPIKQINDESFNLSKGTYDGTHIKTSSEEFDQLNNTLMNANEDILKADKAKKELLGNVSHDLRTPLTMIVGYGEMIRDLPDENNEENINIIIDEAKRLSTLVDDLIDISKFEDSGIDLDLKEISLKDLLVSVYHQYEKYCKAQNIDFKLENQDDAMIVIDEKRIRQVLYNFINNALNYNNSDKQIIILGEEKIDGGYRIYVYDNGIGIKQEDVDNIWDRYYKVDKQHKRHHIGSGIGLSLSKEILEAHNLNYGVESKYQEYSKFYFDVMV